MAKPRPLSPHLQVYRPQLTSVMSIMHRASGVVLTTGTIILALWLIAVANGPETFAVMASIVGHPLGQFVLFGYTVALFYHACNGIRHLNWDLGLGLAISDVYRGGYFVLVVSCSLTVLFWLSVWF